LPELGSVAAARAGRVAAGRAHPFARGVAVSDGEPVLLNDAGVLWLVDVPAATVDFLVHRALEDICEPDHWPQVTLRVAVADAVAAEHRKRSPLGVPREASLAAAVGELVKHRHMLREYFGIGLTAGGVLVTMPCLLEGLAPAAEDMPAFLHSLATRVDWARERACLETVCGLLAAACAGSCSDAVFHRLLLPAMRQAYTPAAAVAYKLGTVQIASAKTPGRAVI